MEGGKLWKPSPTNARSWSVIYDSRASASTPTPDSSSATPAARCASATSIGATPIPISSGNGRPPSPAPSGFASAIGRPDLDDGTAIDPLAAARGILVALGLSGLLIGLGCLGVKLVLRWP